MRRFRRVPLEGDPFAPPAEILGKTTEILPDYFPDPSGPAEAAEWIVDNARCLAASRVIHELWARPERGLAEAAAQLLARAFGDLGNIWYYRALCLGVAAKILPGEILTQAVHEMLHRFRDRTGDRKPPGTPGAYFGPVISSQFDDWNRGLLGPGGGSQIDQAKTMAKLEEWLEAEGWAE